MLCERSLSLKELQRSLRMGGFRHSQRTIVEAYVKPLIRAGLVSEDGSRFRVTFYGRKVHDVLCARGSLGLSPLPIHSCCYEETVLKALAEPKTFEELAGHVPPKSLSRILMRLKARGLLKKSGGRNYVFYHRARGKPKIRLSPTERRVWEAVPQEGIAVRQLHETVGINLRRTFKYLRRLREKKLVFALKVQRTYELTGLGMEVVGALNEVEKLALSFLNVPVPVAQTKP